MQTHCPQPQPNSGYHVTCTSVLLKVCATMASQQWVIVNDADIMHHHSTRWKKADAFLCLRKW